MKYKFLFLFLSLFIISSLYSQEKYTISGYVIDQATGESLIGVNVILLDKFGSKGCMNLRLENK